MAPTWNTLADLEPKLATLEGIVRRIADQAGKRRRWCRNARWAGSMTDTYPLCRALSHLVGWEIHHGADVLRTHEAFEACRVHLMGLLPPCRGCNCM